MSRFRIDHLDGPRYDFINGRYYGNGAAFAVPLGDIQKQEKKGEEPMRKKKRKRPAHPAAERRHD